MCGDAVQEWSEQCDDGNQAADDGCSPECALDAGYYCDYYTGCAPVVCGDGMTQAYGDGAGNWLYEECDDLNSESGDGCSSSCAIETGYVCGYPGEACHEVTCGDGYQDGYWVGGDPGGTGGTGFGGAGGGVSGTWVYEQCDDANSASGDGCSSECEIEPDYICPAPGLPCRIPVCGDGFQDLVPGPGPGGGAGGGAGSGGIIIVGGGGGVGGGGVIMHYEDCDDGNVAPDDGCSEECTMEAGYSCPQPGQPCKLAVCGDGVYDWPTETCDDGNTISGDGCSSTCQYEFMGTGGFGSGGFAGVGGMGSAGTGWGGSG